MSISAPHSIQSSKGCTPDVPVHFQIGVVTFYCIYMRSKLLSCSYCLQLESSVFKCVASSSHQSIPSSSTFNGELLMYQHSAVPDGDDHKQSDYGIISFVKLPSNDLLQELSRYGLGHVTPSVGLLALLKNPVKRIGLAIVRK
ncbi:hypothetical protein SERLA73DRAFT_149077 [Serpula lacrymans var. lacrymans S7.3]|uniref:Uncharacterized protein n=1 Tax=Serpula lacrymans var. lacrymans (strain S7.3) TaxID=936435 RepID=F8PEY7_SERL3|nr:hypothetical protein SERLA73DRAFT_149077 [Serpula lacrymans var. lacrymans S7.3]